MVMTEGEIIRNYRNARLANAQVGILAELNCCSKDEIREVLERNGITLPKPKPEKRGRKPKPKMPDQKKPKEKKGRIWSADPCLKGHEKEFAVALAKVLSGTSQAKLSRVTGVSQAAICRYVSGQDLPSEKTFTKMTKALGTTRKDFLKIT